MENNYIFTESHEVDIPEVNYLDDPSEPRYTQEDVDNEVITVYVVDEFKSFIDSLDLFRSRFIDDSDWYTAIAPPDVESGMSAVFDFNTDTWSVVEDHRGTVEKVESLGVYTVVDYLGPIKT